MRFSFLALSITLGLTTLATASLAMEFDALNEHSIGLDALMFQNRASLNFQLDSILIDGQVKTLPVDTVTYDRTATTRSRFWGSVPLGNQFGTRFSLFSNASYRKEEGKTEPRKISEEQWVEGEGSLEAVIFTATKLEIFFGLTYHYFPGFERTTETASVDTTTEFSTTSFPSPHIGVVKRAGFVHGGFYYKQGAEKNRSVKKTSTGDESELRFSEAMHSPSVVAMFAKVPTGVGYMMAEFAAVQGSDGGNKTDDGDTVTEDYMRARLLYTLFPGGIGFRAGLVHRTLSYADNRSVTLDTIPMTALHLKMLFGAQQFYGFAGVIYGYSKDGQSIPEFNATYKTGAYGFSAGLSLSL